MEITKEFIEKQIDALKVKREELNANFHRVAGAIFVYENLLEMVGKPEKAKAVDIKNGKEAAPIDLGDIMEAIARKNAEENGPQKDGDTA